MSSKNPPKSRGSKLREIVLFIALFASAFATLAIQNKQLNRLVSSIPAKLSQFSFINKSTINFVSTGDPEEDCYIQNGHWNSVTKKCEFKTSVLKSTAPKATPSKAGTNNTEKLKAAKTNSECARYAIDDCPFVPGCKVSGNACISSSTTTTTPALPPPPPTAPETEIVESTGLSCPGATADVKIKDGQYAYSGGKDSQGNYLCWQCQNGSWSTDAQPCQGLHSSGATVVAPPPGTAEGTEGGARRKNCSLKQGSEYVTVGDGTTRADGQKCMDGAWVDPADYKSPDYVKPSQPAGTESSSSTSTTTTPGGSAACNTSYVNSNGVTVTVTVPHGESAIGGASVDGTTVKICKNGEFVACNDANRADTPAVTNCTTPTVKAGYMTTGNSSQATCIIGSGYQLPAGRVIASGGTTQVCKDGAMVAIPLDVSDVGDYLLGTKAGTSLVNLTLVTNLCKLYGNTNCTGNGLDNFASTWLSQADPTYAAEVSKQKHSLDLFDVATGRADQETSAALAKECQTKLGHACTDSELSTYALNTLKTTDPNVYTQAQEAIAATTKLQADMEAVYAYYINPNDPTSQAKVMEICRAQQSTTCTQNNLLTFAENQLNTYDPSGQLLKDAQAAQEDQAYYNVAIGNATELDTSSVKQDCIRDRAITAQKSRGSGGYNAPQDCSTSTGLSDYAVTNLAVTDPEIAAQANSVIHAEDLLASQLNSCRHTHQDWNTDCVVDEKGRVVQVELDRDSAPSSLGTRKPTIFSASQACGGYGEICCIDQQNKDVVFKGTDATTACAFGTTCQGDSNTEYGRCEVDVAVSRSLATTSLIQQKVNSGATSETINDIIQNNAFVDPNSVAALDQTNSTLCAASCGKDGICAYSDSTKSYSCQQLSSSGLTSAYYKSASTITPYNTDPSRGGLDQSCYKESWFKSGSCDNDYLSCDNGTCQINDTGRSLLTIQTVSTTPATLSLNLTNVDPAVSSLATYISTNTTINSAGCNESYSTYTSNNSCFICWDSNSKSVQQAPDPSYCSNSAMADTLPGKKCSQSGGYCAGNDTIATGGVARTGQSDCPSSMQCFKYTPPSVGFAANSPNQSRPGLGNSCDDSHPDSICANGLMCINNMCVDQISASFNLTFQEGRLANSIRTNDTLNSIPLFDWMIDHVVAPVTAAIDPDYYRASSIQADVAHSLVNNALSQPELKANLSDNFILNTLETLHGDAKVKYQLNTLDEINAGSSTDVEGTGTYNFLANLSFFTGAWTERYVIPPGPRTGKDIPEAPPIDNAFYGYAYNYAQSNAQNQDGSYLDKVFTAQGFSGAANFGIEIAFTAADFLTPPGLADSIPTLIAKNANEALVSRAAGATLRETAELAFKEAAQKGTATAFVKATSSVVTDAFYRSVRTTFSRPQVWGSAIESSIGRTFVQSGITQGAKVFSSRLIQGTTQMATGIGLTRISNFQAIKTFTRGVTNVASSLFTGIEKSAYYLANNLGITSTAYENRNLIDALIKNLEITGDNLVHLNPDSLFAEAVSTGFKGSQDQFAKEILTPLQVKVLQNTPTNLLSTLSVPHTNLQPDLIEKIYLSTGVDVGLETQTTYLLKLSQEYAQNPYDLKIISDLMSQSRVMGITLTNDQITPFARTLLQITSNFPQTGPLTRDALQIAATTHNLAPDATRSLILGLETTQSPLIIPLTRSYNPLSPSTFLRTQESISPSALTTRLQLAGIPPQQASNLASTVLHNNPNLATAHAININSVPGNVLTNTFYLPRHEDTNLIANWFDPQTNRLTKVEIKKGQLIPIPGQTLSQPEEALLVSLNNTFATLRKASGFTSLRDEQIDADLRTILKIAQTPDDTNLKIILNPTTGGGKNTVIVPLLAQYDLERGRLFIEGVNSVQLEDAFKRDIMLTDLYGRDNVFQLSRTDAGTTIIKDLNGKTVDPSELSTRISLLKGGDSSAKPFKLTMQTDHIGFALNDVLALESGEMVTDPAFAKMWADIFSTQPSANIDEIGTLTGRWMTSTGTPTPVAQLLGDSSLGLANGQELLDIFARSASDPVVLAARNGTLPLPRNLQSKTLDALPSSTNQSIIKSSLQQGINALPPDSTALPILQKALAESDFTALTNNFDALRRSTLAELQHQFGDTAADLYRALRVADGYHDAVFSRLSVISMVPGDDYKVAEGLVQLAQDKAITKQQYSAPMQALALQDEGALKLNYTVCPSMALLPSSSNVLGDAVGCLVPLSQIQVNPRSIVSDSSLLFDRLGHVYATDATDALPRAKFGFTTLYDSLPLHEPNLVQTGSTLSQAINQLGSAANAKLQNNEIAMIVDMQSGASIGQNLDATTLATIRATQAELPAGQHLYLALMNGDGTQTLYKIDPTSLAKATSLEEIGVIIERDLTPEELYAKSIATMNASADNKVVAYFQNRTRATNFKPANGDPPKKVISEVLALGDVDTFIKDTTFQTAGRLRGYAASPYSLFLSGTTENLTPSQAVSRALANQARVTGEEATARMIADITTNQSRGIVNALRTAGSNNPSFLAELSQFERQISEAGLAFPTTPIKQDTIQVLFDEYQTSLSRNRAILERARINGIDPKVIGDLSNRYSLNNPLALSDFHAALSGSLLPSRDFNARNSLIANLNEIGSTIPSTYSRGSRNTMALADIARSLTPSSPTNPGSGITNTIGNNLRQLTATTLSSITSVGHNLFSASRALTTRLTSAITRRQIAAPSYTPTLSIPTGNGATQQFAIANLLQDVSFNSLVFTLHTGHTVDATSLRNNPRELFNFLPSPTQVRSIRYNGIDLPASAYQELASTTPANATPTIITRIRMFVTPLGNSLGSLATNLSTRSHALSTSLRARLSQQQNLQPVSLEKPYSVNPNTSSQLASWGVDSKIIDELTSITDLYTYFNPISRLTRMQDTPVELDSIKTKETTVAQIIFPEGRNYDSTIEEGECGELACRVFNNTQVQQIIDSYPSANGPLKIIVLSGKSPTHFSSKTSNHIFLGIIPQELYDKGKIEEMIVLDPSLRNIAPFVDSQYQISKQIKAKNGTAREIINSATITPTTNGFSVTRIQDDIIGSEIILGMSNDGLYIYKLGFGINQQTLTPYLAIQNEQSNIISEYILDNSNNLVTSNSNLQLSPENRNQIIAILKQALKTNLENSNYSVAISDIGQGSQITPADTSIQPFLAFLFRDIPEALRPVGDFFRSRGNAVSNTTTSLLRRFATRQEDAFDPSTLTFPRGVDINTGRFSAGAYFTSLIRTNTPWHRINLILSDLSSGRTNLATATTQIQALNLDQARRDLIVNSIAATYPASVAPAPAPAAPTQPTTKASVNLGGQTLNIDLSQPVTMRPQGYIDSKHSYFDTFSSTYSSSSIFEQQFTQTSSNLLARIQDAVNGQRLAIDKVTAAIDITYTDHNGKKYSTSIKLDTSGVTPAPTQPSKVNNSTYVYESQISKHITGFSISDTPQLTTKVLNDQTDILAELGLPKPELRRTNPAEYLAIILNIASKYNIPIKSFDDIPDQFKNEAPNTNAFYDDTWGTNAVYVKKPSSTDATELGKLIHEIVHAIDYRLSPNLPIESKEYRAYIAEYNLSSLKTDSIENAQKTLAYIFGDKSIAGSVRGYLNQNNTPNMPWEVNPNKGIVVNLGGQTLNIDLSQPVTIKSEGFINGKMAIKGSYFETFESGESLSQAILVDQSYLSEQIAQAETKIKKPNHTAQITLTYTDHSGKQQSATFPLNLPISIQNATQQPQLTQQATDFGIQAGAAIAPTKTPWQQFLNWLLGRDAVFRIVDNPLVANFITRNAYSALALAPLSQSVRQPFFVFVTPDSLTTEQPEGTFLKINTFEVYTPTQKYRQKDHIGLLELPTNMPLQSLITINGETKSISQFDMQNIDGTNYIMLNTNDRVTYGEVTFELTPDSAGQSDTFLNVNWDIGVEPTFDLSIQLTNISRLKGAQKKRALAIFKADLQAKLQAVSALDKFVQELIARKPALDKNTVLDLTLTEAQKYQFNVNEINRIIEAANYLYIGKDQLQHFLTSYPIERDLWNKLFGFSAIGQVKLMYVDTNQFSLVTTNPLDYSRAMKIAFPNMSEEEIQNSRGSNLKILNNNFRVVLISPLSPLSEVYVNNHEQHHSQFAFRNIVMQTGELSQTEKIRLTQIEQQINDLSLSKIRDKKSKSNYYLTSTHIFPVAEQKTL